MTFLLLKASKSYSLASKVHFGCVIASKTLQKLVLRFQKLFYSLFQLIMAQFSPNKSLKFMPFAIKTLQKVHFQHQNFISASQHFITQFSLASLARNK